MKTKILQLITCLSIVLSSCSGSDDNPSNSGGGDTSTATTYMPLTVNNYWKYDVHTVTDPSGTNQISDNVDMLTATSDVTLNNIAYKKMTGVNETAGTATPAGFFSGALNNNNVRIDGSKLRVTGTISSGATLPTPIEITITDFVFFKEGAASGDTLDSTSGTLSQTVNMSGVDVPLTVEYTLTSKGDGTLSSYAVNGNTFQNISKTKMILELKVTGTLTIGGFPVTMPLLEKQEVLVSNQYYAKNVGMIYSSNNVQYTLNPQLATLGFSIPGVPSSGTQTSTESIKTYLIN